MKSMKRKTVPNVIRPLFYIGPRSQSFVVRKHLDMKRGEGYLDRKGGRHSEATVAFIRL